jgi:hypothetical protein
MLGFVGIDLHGINWDSVRQWVIAFGTLIAAGAAVYVGVIREWRSQPKLSLHFDPDDSTDAQLVGLLHSGTAAFARLRVKNQPRRKTAEEVEIVVWRVEILVPDPTRRHTKSPLSDLSLAVSNTEPQPTSKVNIAPGAERHIDFVHVEVGASALWVDVYPYPVDQRNIIDARTIELELVLTARNAAASRHRVTVEWDGQFVEKNIWDHLKVGEIRRV